MPFSTSRSVRNLDPLLYCAVAVALGIVFTSDLVTPLGVVVWILYLVPILLCLYVSRPTAVFFVAGTASALLLAGFVLSGAGVAVDFGAINRVIGLATIWIVAAIVAGSVRAKLALRRQEWLDTGQRLLAEQLVGDKNLRQLGDSILGFLAPYLDAKAGVVFVEEEGAFVRAGAYAVPSLAQVPARFQRGEGLLGQAVKDGRAFTVDELPADYLRIGSALGEAAPRHLLIAPAVIDGATNAVVELGFLRPVTEDAEELMRRVSEPMAVALRSAQYRSRLQELLAETQSQSEELQAQSEELRVSNEELSEQSRALKENNVRLEQQQAELEQTNAQLENTAQILELQKADLARAKESLEVQAGELRQASRYKSEFLANMSHELRTPLNSSLILSKLLADNPRGNLDAEQIKFAETIHASGQDLLTLINDVLDLSKIEAGRLEVDARPVRIRSLVENLERTFAPLAGDKGLRLVLKVDPRAPEIIDTDPQRLEQILNNLLSNAVKFTEHGEVALEVSPGGDDQVAFAVRDTGIGIDPAQQHVIFEPFRQANGTTSRRYGGTGLGLSIAREFVRLLQGDLHVESAPGRGSTFTLLLPRVLRPAAPPPVPPAPNPAPPGPPAPATAHPRPPRAEPHRAPPPRDDRERLAGDRRIVLIVEDDRAFAQILFDLAHEQGFQALIADTSESALALCAQYAPSAVLLDVGLPDSNGLSVLDRLKTDVRTRHIPVHIVSGENYMEAAYAMGASGYSLKPVKREELVDAFRGLETKLTQKLRRVLVVEDDPVQRESLRLLLGSRDVEAVGAGNARDCLAALESGAFDCMVLDLSLPDGSGFGLLETLSREDGYSFPPVIVYTGRELERDEEQRLRRYSKSIIIKGAKSPERLLDEVTLFLHQVVSELPDEQQTLLRKSRSRDAALEGRRILIVEDDVRNVFALTSILEPRGALLQIARNGREGLEALERSRASPAARVDLVLMDVMMPEMDGLTATRELRKRPEWKKLPVIILTAKAMKDDQERCLEAGANDYISKPLDVEKLLSLVRVWMPR